MAAQRATTAKAKKSVTKRTAAPAKPRRSDGGKIKAPAKPVKAPVTPILKTKAPAKKTEAIPAPVPVKKVKVSSGLSKAELNRFRDLLLEKRREILGDVGTMESEAFKAGSNLSNMPIHMADVGTDNFEQEFTLGLIESERQMLRDIQEALQRIEDGSFGICQATGKPIGKVRLTAAPWAKYTMEYQRALEQGLVRRDSGAARDDDGDDEEE